MLTKDKIVTRSFLFVFKKLLGVKNLKKTKVERRITMGRCVVVCGGMASGKTTLVTALAQGGFKRIVTYTTRPKRNGEKEGVDYHFISDQEFHMGLEAGFFAETTAYNTVHGLWLYGSAKRDYESNDNRVIILNPRGVINLFVAQQTLIKDPFVVFLDLKHSVLKSRALERGDSLAEIDRRILDDRLYFDEMLKIITPNITTHAELPVNDMVEWIIDSIELQK